MQCARNTACKHQYIGENIQVHVGELKYYNSIPAVAAIRQQNHLRAFNVRKSDNLTVTFISGHNKFTTMRFQVHSGCLWCNAQVSKTYLMFLKNCYFWFLNICSKYSKILILNNFTLYLLWSFQEYENGHCWFILEKFYLLSLEMLHHVEKFQLPDQASLFYFLLCPSPTTYKNC